MVRALLIPGMLSKSNEYVHLQQEAPDETEGERDTREKSEGIETIFKTACYEARNPGKPADCSV